MNAISKKPNKITQDEMSDEEMSENQTEDESQHFDEKSEEEEESSESGDESSNEDKNHPYPTPPPDANANVVPVLDQVMPVMAASKKTASKSSIIDATLAAIKALKSRSGSSVPAIVKYIMSTGYEVTDEKRFSSNVYKRLKVAVTSGQVIQVKRSFKLSDAAPPAPKSIEKMKAKALKKKQAKKQDAKAKPAVDGEKEKGGKTKKVTVEASEPTEPPVKKNKADPSVVKVNVKEIAKKPKKKAEKPKTTETKKNAAKKNASLDELKGDRAKNQRAKTVRKSIGTLAQPHAKPKLQVKAIKKLAAGPRNPDEIDSDIGSEPTQASTPVAAVKQKGKGQKSKAT